MKIYTSYFASKAPTERKVSIAKKAPVLFRGQRFLAFAPSKPWAKNWQELYRYDLEKRFPHGHKLQETLKSICIMTPDPVLCCYEKSVHQCHRKILAEFIGKYLDVEVKEWQA
jgi:hypothetical protein